MLDGLLFEEGSVWLFLLVTVVMGGWAGWMAARGIAKGWRPYWHCVPALLLVAAAVRFIHFALFGGHAALGPLLRRGRAGGAADRLGGVSRDAHPPDDEPVPLALREDLAADMASARVLSLRRFGSP